MANTVKIPNVGLAIIANAINSLASNKPVWLDWGTGTNDPLATDIGLQTPRTEARVEGESSVITTYVNQDTYRVVGILVCQDTPVTIGEVGLFTASTNGTLFSRTKLETPQALAVGDSIEFQYGTVFK